ncbi:MAG TPA: hypothetical protein VLZ11_00375 [Flavobacterium sp.]|nr:hypothetical protein [Flavobacterium sp.]
MKNFLRLFSYLFHPLFIPIMATLLYFYYGTSYSLFSNIYLIIIQTTLITVIIPILLFFLLFLFRQVDSLMVADINQRKIPLMFQITLFFYLIKRIIRPEYFNELYFCFLASILSTFLAFILLFFKQKASLHMLGITSLTTFALLLSYHTQYNFIYLIAFLIFCCGAVASSRLVMKAHDGKELVLGTLIGVIPQLIMAFVWV